jgi:tetratricopeptide (TPR) repeat protein
MLKNLGLSFLSLALFLLLAEAVAYLCGVKPSAHREDPFVGFRGYNPLFIPDSTGEGMVTAPAKLRHFNLQRFRREKPKGAYRIFTLGGSTTYGHPYRDPVSYSGWMREMLPLADPGKKWEVINCGGVSYASYREARLMEELAQYQPDLFVIYSGHNEFLEERSYRKLKKVPAWVTSAASALSHLRSYSALQAAYGKMKAHAGGSGGSGKAVMPEEVRDILAETAGPTSYTRDDEKKKEILAHFAVSLARMAEIAHGAGAQVIFVTTPSNIKDCSPFKSEPAAGLTAEEIAGLSAHVGDAEKALAARDFAQAGAEAEAALRIDARHPQALYLAGRAAFGAGAGAGDKEKARSYFMRARDEDICPLRALTVMDTLVEEAARRGGAWFLDFDRLLEEKCRREQGHGALGVEYFLDHVHPDVATHGFLARCLLDKMKSEGVIGAGWPLKPQDSARASAAVLGRIDRLAYGESLHNLAKVLNWAGKREESDRIAVKALETAPDHIEAVYSSVIHGTALEREGKTAEAVPQYRRAVSLDSNNEEARRLLGIALARLGQPEEAERHLTAALRLDPSDLKPHRALGHIYFAWGRTPEAAEHFAQALRLEPDDAELNFNLGVCYHQLGRLEEAKAQYEKTLRLNPGFGMARAYLERLP